MEILKLMLVIFLTIGLFNTGLAKPAEKPQAEADDDDYDAEGDVQGDDDYNYYDEKSEENKKAIATNDATVEDPHPPFFETSDLSIEASQGETVILQCDVRNFKISNVVMWYNGSKLITQGKYVLNEDKRIKMVENNGLQITGVEEADTNDYYCQVLPNNIRLHIHLIVANKGGRVAIFSRDRDITERAMTVRQGEKLEFECRTSGIQNAIIKWSLNGKRADEYVSNGKVTINQVDAEHAGVYQCLGDDGSEKPPIASVTINVLYAPKVSTHRHHVNTDLNGKPELYCDYKADPIAIVQWKKSGQYLETYSDRYMIKSTHHKEKNRTVLIIKDVDQTDLGEYECEVKNSIGASEAKVHLILEPEHPQFEKMEIEGRKVILFWLVRSVQPLSEAVLDYQMDNSYSWSTETIIHTEKHPEHTGVWKLRHEIELSPGFWHARVRTKNTVGWSSFSQPHDFRIDNEEDQYVTEGNSIPNDILAAGIGMGSKKGASSSPALSSQFTTVVLSLSLCASLVRLLAPSAGLL